MPMIRMQNNVPDVYTESSRDFQYLCRLFDLPMNQMKLDADLIQHLTNTKECKNNSLSLLQTKLGFFTKYSYTDTMMREFLSAFPYAIKYKGTLTGIRYAVNAFAKAKNINDKIIVEADSTDTFNVLIKTQKRLEELDKLDEFLSYILPVGLTYSIEFYEKLPTIVTTVDVKNNGNFILADNITNSAIAISKTGENIDDLTTTTEVSTKYSLLNVEPDDWATNFMDYYEYDGSSWINVSGTTAPTFVIDKYAKIVDSGIYDSVVGSIGLAGLSGSHNTTTRTLKGNSFED